MAQIFPEESRTERGSRAKRGFANLPVIGTGRFLEVILVLEEEGQQSQYACEAFRWLDKLLRPEEDTREAPPKGDEPWTAHTSACV